MARRTRHPTRPPWTPPTPTPRQLRVATRIGCRLPLRFLRHPLPPQRATVPTDPQPHSPHPSPRHQSWLRQVSPASHAPSRPATIPPPAPRPHRQPQTLQCLGLLLVAHPPDLPYRRVLSPAPVPGPQNRSHSHPHPRSLSAPKQASQSPQTSSLILFQHQPQLPPPPHPPPGAPAAAVAA